MHIGFTGTRSGMTPSQKLSVIEIMRLLVEAAGRDFSDRSKLVVHHGDCVGADADFHAIARAAGAWIVIHPPIDNGLRAFCEGDEFLPPLTHFARNRAIVAASSALIATPYEQERQERGGTWYTYDRAILAGQTVALVVRSVFDMPDYPAIVQYAHAMSVVHTWPTAMIK